MSILAQIMAKLQQGPPTSQGRPNKGSAEDLEQLKQPLRVHKELGHCNVDHPRSGCYYDDGNFASGSDFDDTFDDRCYFGIGTFENRCNECDPIKRGLQMTTFQPRQWSLAPHLGEDQEEGASLDSSLMMLMVCYTTLLLVLHCIPTKGPTRAKTTFCSFGPADNFFGVPGALTT